jgi:hypothetical protein
MPQPPNSPDTHSAYERYNNPVTSEIRDSAENIIIAPESVTIFLSEYKNARRAIWWLSVDFYHMSVRMFIESFPQSPFFDILSPFDCCHFCDCAYARKHLELFSIPQNRIMMLESYLHPFYVKNALYKPKLKKENFVTFNPSKGYVFTQRLLMYCMANGYEHIKFVALEGFTQEEVTDIYKLCKLHIDFGEFPGREYIPREAVINDCCIITGKKGASKYHEDVPIPEKYKFDHTDEALPLIAECIDRILNNYDECVKDFAEYKQFALNLERAFEREIRENFIKTP